MVRDPLARRLHNDFLDLCRRETKDKQSAEDSRSQKYAAHGFLLTLADILQTKAIFPLVVNGRYCQPDPPLTEGSSDKREWVVFDNRLAVGSKVGDLALVTQDSIGIYETLAAVKSGNEDIEETLEMFLSRGRCNGPLLDGSGIDNSHNELLRIAIWLALIGHARGIVIPVSHHLCTSIFGRLYGLFWLRLIQLPILSCFDLMMRGCSINFHSVWI